MTLNTILLQGDKLYLKAMNNHLIHLPPGVIYLSVSDLPKLVIVSCFENELNFDICCQTEQNIDLPVGVDSIELPVVVSDPEQSIVTSNTELPIVVSHAEPPIMVGNTELPIVVSDTEPPIMVGNTESPIVVSDTEPPIVVGNTGSCVRNHSTFLAYYKRRIPDKWIPDRRIPDLQSIRGFSPK